MSAGTKQTEPKPNRRAADPIWDVVIIGCGRIAGGYDTVAGDAAVRTHAGAYSQHSGFSISACIDPDDTLREAFMETWSVPLGYGSVADWVTAGGRAEVASICAPTRCHGDIANTLCTDGRDRGLRAIFAEKPMTDSFEESTKLVDRCRSEGILLMVSYLRRWYPELQALAVELQSGTWGAIRSVVCVYNKGIMNSGSHLLDLLSLLVGECSLRSVGHIRHDYDADDPTVDAVLESVDGIPITLVGSDNRDHTCFELQFFTEKGVVTIEEMGRAIRYRRPVESSEFPGNVDLSRGVWRETSHRPAIRAAIDNLYGALVNGTPLASSGETALIGERICHEIRDRARARL